MFGTSLDIEFSCLDPDCEGTVVAQFADRVQSDDSYEIVECVSNCCECGHEYSVLRKNWSDTPTEEIAWTVLP